VEKVMRHSLTRGSIKLIFAASIVMATSANAGDSKQFEDWYRAAADDGSYVFAVTSNLNGDSLGEFCYLDKHCEWRFTIKNFSCDPGAKSTILVNANAGTNSVETKCLGSLIKDAWTSQIMNWSTFESVVENNPEVGFAIAGQGTSFRAIRFSLRGMKAATASIGAPINPAAPNASAKPAKDNVAL
jgi:hypothetical protein